MSGQNFGCSSAGLGRWEEAEPLLDAAAESLSAAFGPEYEAAGEAQFYLALLEVAASAEASLPTVDAELLEARLSWQ